MTDKLMYIPKITSSVYYNQWLKCLVTQLNEQTNQNAIKIPKLLSLQIGKYYYKTLGTSVMMSNVLFLPAYTHSHPHSHPHTHTNRGVHCILTTGNLEFFAICPIQETAMLNTNFSQGGRGHWAVYNTSPQSFILIMFSNLLA